MGDSGTDANLYKDRSKVRACLYPRFTNPNKRFHTTGKQLSHHQTTQTISKKIIQSIITTSKDQQSVINEKNKKEEEEKKDIKNHLFDL